MLFLILLGHLSPVWVVMASKSSACRIASFCSLSLKCRYLMFEVSVLALVCSLVFCGRLVVARKGDEVC